MTDDMGASGKPDRATAVEPVPVSPLRDGIPSAALRNLVADFRQNARICRTNPDGYCPKAASVWDLAADAVESANV